MAAHVRRLFDGGQRSRFTGNSLVCFLLRLFSLSSRLNVYSRHILKIPSFTGHAPGKDTLRAANAAMKEGVNGGENGLSVSDYPLSSPSK